jgi:hypothetical protein
MGTEETVVHRKNRREKCIDKSRVQERFGNAI